MAQSFGQASKTHATTYLEYFFFLHKAQLRTDLAMSFGTYLIADDKQIVLEG